MTNFLCQRWRRKYVRGDGSISPAEGGATTSLGEINPWASEGSTFSTSIGSSYISLSRVIGSHSLPVNAPTLTANTSKAEIFTVIQTPLYYSLTLWLLEKGFSSRMYSENFRLIMCIWSQSTLLSSSLLPFVVFRVARSWLILLITELILSYVNLFSDAMTNHPAASFSLFFQKLSKVLYTVIKSFASHKWWIGITKCTCLLKFEK